MSRSNLRKLSVEQLVEQFTELAVQQDAFLLSGPQRHINKLFWEISAVSDELKARSGDQRSVLLPLYGHDNMHVRLKAAKATLAIAPLAARAQLQAIRESGWQPQALEAGMCLFSLDRGIYKPT